MHDTVILTADEVRTLLPMADCMAAMERTLAALSSGNGANPLRWPFWLPDRRGLIGMMPGMSAEPEAVGLKAAAVYPGNHGTEWDAHQGVVLLFHPDNGVPVAIVDGSEITAIRTAAVSGVATRLLANEDVRVLGLIGAGVQARTHLEAMRVARPSLREVRVYSRSPENRARFAERAREAHGIEILPCEDAESVVRGADVVCTVTSSNVPVLLGDWLSPGTHVNAVGSSAKTAREVDVEAVVVSRFFVDRRESTVNESRAFLAAKEKGRIGDDHILAEIGEVSAGRHPGREAAAEITLFKSLGLAVEDLAATHLVMERALERGVGARVPLGGRSEAAPS